MSNPSINRLPVRVQELLAARPLARAAFDKRAAVLGVGIRIRALRETAKLSQEQLAKRVGTTQAHISDLERGAGKQGPSFVMMEAIEHACIGDAGSLESLVAGAVGDFAKSKLEAIAATLNTHASMPAVAAALVCLIRERVPANLMRGIRQSDLKSAVAMVEVMEELSECSFVPVQSEDELKDLLLQHMPVVAVAIAN